MLGEPVSRRDLIEVALGRKPPDLLIRGGVLVNVHTREIYPADVIVEGDRIAAVGDVAGSVGPETAVVDATGRYLVPGLIETHLHHCHSSFGVSEFVEALLMHGITAFADGFYGPAMVGGVDAVRFFKQAFERLPIRLLFLVPVLAYTQNRELGLTPARSISVSEMHEMLDWEGCYGLEEPPPVPVLHRHDEIVDLLAATLDRRKVITGHAAALDVRQIQAYAAAGAQTDHEMVGAAEAREKARAGLKLLARQGDPGCEDAPQVLRAHTELRIDPRAFAFCSDLASAPKLVTEGTVDHAVRVAISNGTLPVAAIQMATLNAAEALSADQDLGSIAPGRYADLLLVEELAELSIAEVVVGGRTVVRDGSLVGPLPITEYPNSFYGTVRLPEPLSGADLTFSVDRPDGEVEVRAISVTDEGSLLFSPERRVTLPVREGRVEADPDADVARLAIIDRLDRGTGIGLGFAHGFGLRRGAFASSLTALTMNVVVVGADAADMAVAANRLAESGGGKVVVDRGEVVAEVGLPVLGLHSDRPMLRVLRELERASDAIAALGCRLADPFSQLEFCFACQDIGDIKLSEEGLMQVRPPQRLEVVV
jgi:adenine deaminase